MISSAKKENELQSNSLTIGKRSAIVSERGEATERCETWRQAGASEVKFATTIDATSAIGRKGEPFGVGEGPQLSLAGPVAHF